jgi:Ca2+:H+ antiporter
MAPVHYLPKWSIAAPIAGVLFLGGASLGLGGFYFGILAAALLAAVLAAVHHAETVAHRVGEPYGTLVLAVAVTVIEVGLIVTLTLAGGPEASSLARDTVFAAVMIILNGIVGLCLLIGGGLHREQSFGLHGVSASLATLAAIIVLTLVLPNFTVTAPGPYYSKSQLALIAVVSLVLYGTFVLIQTVRHRDYFLPVESGPESHAPLPSGRISAVAAVLLLICLVSVVLLAKSLAPVVEAIVKAAGAPKAAVGIVISAMVLMPEGLAAIRAARANRLQTSLNLALGSALASIGLTIPAVAVISITNGWALALGIDAEAGVLLVLSLFVASLSLGTGRTTVLQGAVHLGIFVVYLFMTLVP